MTEEQMKKLALREHLQLTIGMKKASERAGYTSIAQEHEATIRAIRIELGEVHPTAPASVRDDLLDGRGYD